MKIVTSSRLLRILLLYKQRMSWNTVLNVGKEVYREELFIVEVVVVVLFKSDVLDRFLTLCIL